MLIENVIYILFCQLIFLTYAICNSIESYVYQQKNVVGSNTVCPNFIDIFPNYDVLAQRFSNFGGLCSSFGHSQTPVVPCLYYCPKGQVKTKKSSL